MQFSQKCKKETLEQISTVIGLDFLAAFVSVYRGIVLTWLQSKFGFTETLLACLQMYLEGWIQFVKMDLISHQL